MKVNPKNYQNGSKDLHRGPLEDSSFTHECLVIGLKIYFLNMHHRLSELYKSERQNG